MAYDPTFLGGPYYYAGKTNAKDWLLDSIDLLATIIATGYISDGLLRQMSKGDLVTVRRWDSLVTKATLASVSRHYVSAVSATGAVTLSAAIGDASGLTVPVVSSTATPAVTDDVADGYALGSLWVETDVDDVYVTTDNATGAAIWKPIVNRFTVEHNGLDIDNDGGVGTIDIVLPCAAKLLSAHTVLPLAVTLTAAASVTIALSRNATAITNGTILIAAASGSGTVASCTPTALNIFAAGDRLRGTVTTTQTADAVANFIALFERLP